MHNFAYHRPASIDDAVRLIEGNSGAIFLAGGQTLLPTLRQRLASPSALIDLGGIAALKGIRVEGDNLVIGAGTAHADVAASAEVQKAIPALAKLASLIGDPQVRNRGTIGGSLANADPAADYPAAVVGLGASLRTNKRTIEGDAFFLDLFTTALQPGEVIREVIFPKPKAAAYVKQPNPASGYAMVGVMVAKTAKGVRVGVTGAGPKAFRATALEQALDRDFSPKAIAGVAIPASGLNADLHATAAYRAHLIGVLGGRAIATCA